MSNEKSRQNHQEDGGGGEMIEKFSNVEGCKREQWQIVNEKEGLGKEI